MIVFGFPTNDTYTRRFWWDFSYILFYTCDIQLYLTFKYIKIAGDFNFGIYSFFFFFFFPLSTV